MFRMPKSGGGGIVVPILISLLATVGIAAGGFGIGTGIGRVMYGPIVASVHDSGQNSSQGSETKMDNNRAHTMGSSLGPNVYEENGVIIWQSEYWGSHGDGSNVTGGEPASTPVTPEPDQVQDTVGDPGQAATAKLVQDQVVQPAQTQAPAQSSTSNTGNGAGASGKTNQPSVNITPGIQSAEKPQVSGGGQTSNLDWPEGKFLASKNGTVYHRMYCEKGYTGAVNIKEENKIWFDSEEDAIAAKYKRCGNCW